MGLMITGVYQDAEVRSDAVHDSTSTRILRRVRCQRRRHDFRGRERLAWPLLHGFGARIEQKQRSGVTAVYQWDVTDSFRMTVDGLFMRLHAPTVGYHQSFYVEDSILDETTGQHRWSDVSIRDHWVDGMTVAELIPEISTITSIASWIRRSSA